LMRFGVSRPVLLFGTCFMLALCVMPPAALAQSGWQPGPGAAQDNTYDGVVDQPASGATVPGSGSFGLNGWFVDTTAQGWAGADDVQVWLGTMDGGGSMVAQAQFGQSRPDVASALANPFWDASGFSASVPGSTVPAGGQTLNVYVHTPGKGWWFLPLNVTGGGSAPATATAAAPAVAAGGPPTASVSSPGEGDNVSAAGGRSFTITGRATDPANGPGAIDSIDIWIFGERDASGATDLGLADFNTTDGSWSLTFKPTKFPSTHTNINVYVHSKATGQTTQIIRGFNIVG
jgi:hypothetical protein